jgi:auxin efflux carrier family protein
MLAPTGPPAMKLTALADVNGRAEQEKMSIAKLLSECSLLPPIFEAI